jgi:glycerol-3-phosphate dehydrogenase
MPVTGLLKDEEGYVNGVIAHNDESGGEHRIQAQVVINATGIFTDCIRQMADPETATMIEPSQGIHLVFERSFLEGDTAIMVPHTSDGRVMFAIPWHDHTLVGTTDTPIQEPSYEPRPFEQEIQFILDTAALYLSRPPKRSDVLSVYVGIRPLVKAGGPAAKTSALSRDHTIHVDNSGLLTITGGKWTTYRHMAEDCVDHAITLGRLREEPCVTKTLKIHGFRSHTEDLGNLWVYGSDADSIRDIANRDPKLAAQLHPDLSYIGAEVAWSTRQEMARTVEDALARRTRALFLNAAAASEMALPTARIMAEELHYGEDWIKQQVDEFKALASQYCLR